MVVDIVFAMMRRSHRCDFTLNLVHFWIKVLIYVFSHCDHLTLKVVACIVRGFSFSEPYIKLLADKRPHKGEKFKLNGLREKPPALAGFILGVCHFLLCNCTVHHSIKI